MNKIYFFLPFLNAGGAESTATVLANNFFKFNKKVEFITVKENIKSNLKLNTNIKINNLDSRKIFLSFFSLINFLRNKEGVIISSLNHCNFLILLYNKFYKHNYKIIITTHNPTKIDYSLNSFFNYFYVFFSKFLIKENVKIVASSYYIKNDFIKKWKINPNQIFVIYPPVTFNDNTKQIPSFKFENKYKYIINIGRLCNQKNQMELIKCFNQISKKINTKLILIGSGNYKNKLKKAVNKFDLNNKVIFISHTENINYFLKNSDVFVLTSKWEGFGLVLVEALNANIPIISYDCPGAPKEILENGKWGKLVKLNNIYDLESAIMDTLKKDQFKINTSERAKIFNVSRAVEEYLSII